MAAVISDSPPNPSCKIMTFRPSMDEFREFNKYLAYMESQGAHRAGVAKVIPPKEWKPRKHYNDIEELVIPAPIQQIVTGQAGLFTQYNIQKKPMTVKEFKQLANSDKYCTPRYIDYEDLERKYWKNLTFVAPIYGADISGSIYDEGIEEWNIAHLNTILDVVEEDCGISIEGVNTPYLYFGMWKTTFAWHTEDMDLYSINYVHFGEPKSWYAVPPEHGKRLERLAQGFFPSSSQGCDAFLRHKMTLISPSVLKKYGIPFDKVTQEAGEFVITFPYGYHAGFNHGFNCAESTNFATVRWIDYGKAAKLCTCMKDMVTISMDIFVRKFQPDRYQLWKQGKDLYTIDHTKPTPESTPELKTWLQRRRKAKKFPQCFQHTRSRSKKLKTPEDKRVSAVVAGAEIIVTEATTDGSKVSEEPGKKVRLVNTGLPSGEEENSSRMQLDQHLLDNVKVAGNIHSDSFSGSFPVLEKTKLEDEDRTDSSHPLSIFEDSVVCVPTSDTYRKEESLKSPDPPVSSIPYHKSEGQASEAENSDKEENVLIEDDVSGLESCGSSLEHGEVPAVKKDEVDGKETSSLAEVERKQMSKSWRHPLNKPPARSPMTLVKQQAASDEELPETTLIEEEVQETEMWARPLVYLWHTRVPNFNAEKTYNAACAKKEPHCAICTLLMPYYKPDNHDEENPAFRESNSAETLMAENEKTKPLIPELCFIYSEENTENYPSNAFIEEDGTSLLISCAKCCVRVHASCYGVPSHDIHNGWLCSRCRKEAWTAECCLCNLRGGALKQTTDKKWAHVICAIAIPEVKFGNVAERTPIDTTRIPLQRLKLRAKACEKTITVGQTVITKHKNTRYYSCRVIGVTSQLFYEVMFDDGSFSLDTFPEDIVSRDCLRLGPPAEGEVVQVKWPDGKLYSAKYLGTNTAHMYQVEFEDGSEIVMKREEIYTLDEELPKRVKARYSTASVMRFEDTFCGADTILGEKKRQRVLSSRFKNEYVDDPGYRTFLKSSFQKKYQEGL
ncbi:lysine-specific demethylase 4C isoform X2 [Falco biarmicus]|uniref:lysine-specific demethylase 4C isoform X2 n=1 Tax=Falco rusticolus TaxID=120794 RepID=UPI000FFCA5C1|nr:lysine-specific demethylase 4C isoform X2 [Falco rusticolus]XP_055554650.1 lysine-specific demethylase 4C isoform X2 [Falco cherrug]XP_055646366.1 lysine-specific demethylase 4C isoform X2 [Falco peregrinus]XP_056180168.1 lysine-specific demethylase 4C isoform X2 [Falco biarmicus]